MKIDTSFVDDDEGVEFQTLACGDCFVWHGSAYMKISETGINAWSFSSNCQHSFARNIVCYVAFGDESELTL